MPNPYEDALEEQERPAGAPAPAPNPYLENMDARDTSQTRALRTAQVQAYDTTPDRAASVDRISRATGLAAEVVERNYDDLNKRVTVDQTPYAKLQEETPALAAWAADPKNAAVAKDDMEQLGLLEWIVTAPQRAFAQSANQMTLGRLRSKSLFGELTQQEKDELGSAKYNATVGGALGAGKSWFRGAVTGTASFMANVGYGLAASAPEIAIGTTVGAIVGGIGGGVSTAGPGAVPGAMAGARFGASVGSSIGGAEFSFQTEAGLAYDEYLEFKPEAGQPIDVDAAKAAAIATGALNAGLEVAGLAAVFKTIPGLKNLGRTGTQAAVKQALRNPSIRSALGTMVKEYGGALTAEVSVEVAQRAVTILSGELAKAASGQIAGIRDYSDIAEDLAREGAGAVQSFALGLAAGPALGAAHRFRQATRAEQASAFYAALAEGATNSKTVARAPEAAQAFLARATKDGPLETLYAPAAHFSEYWQSQGLDPAEVAAQLTGKPDALERALENGEDLQIPTAVYAVKVAGTEHHAALAQELRLGPDEMNVREANEFQAELEKARTAHAERAAAQAEAQLSPAEQVRNQVTATLTEAGVPAEHASTYAALYEGAFGSFAERAGLDPVALYESYGLKVQRPDTGVQQAAVRQPAAPAVTAEFLAHGPDGPLYNIKGGDQDRSTVGASTLAELGIAVPPTPADTGERLSGDELRARALAAQAPEVAQEQALDLVGNLERERAAPAAGAGGVAADPLVDPATGRMDVSNPVEAARAMIKENPRIIKEAAELRARAAKAHQEKNSKKRDPVVDNNAAEPHTVEAPNAESAQPTGPGQPAAQTGADVSDPTEEPLSTPESGAIDGAGTDDRAHDGALEAIPPSARDVFQSLQEGARRLGFTGTDDQLAGQYLEKRAAAATVAADLEEIENDGSWRDLLIEISKVGGISLEIEERGGYAGEIRWLMESLSGGKGGIVTKAKASARGQASIGRKMPLVSAGLKKVAPGVFKAKGGLSLDRVREHLAQDPRWEHRYADGFAELLEDLEDAAAKGHLENQGFTVEAKQGSLTNIGKILEGLYEVKPDAVWWQNPTASDVDLGQSLFDDLLEPPAPVREESQQEEAWRQYKENADRVAQNPEAASEKDLRRAAGYLSDVRASLIRKGQRGDGPVPTDAQIQSIDTEIAHYDGLANELAALERDANQVDTLDTGEQQPRLPGAGAVRETNVATPEVADAPFALTAETSKRKAKQTELFQSAYHGSPHQFEEFSLQAIGTGEGAQAYGWGLYFASKRAVAEGYRERLTGRHDTPEQNLARKQIHEAGSVAGAIALVHKKLAAYDRALVLALQVEKIIDAETFDRAEYDRVAAERDAVFAEAGDFGIGRKEAIAPGKKFLRDALAILESDAPAPGRLFTVEIPENEDYLDWDKPAAEQSDKVKAVLEALGFNTAPIRYPTLKEAARLFERPSVQRDARADIGTREVLREGHHLMLSGDEKAFRRWYAQHGRSIADGTRFHEDHGPRTGEAIYEALTQKAEEEDRAKNSIGPYYLPKSRGAIARLASEMLAAHGIAGIRYLDSFSRNAGEGSHNFVIFDDKLVQVTEYNQAIEAAPPFYSGLTRAAEELPQAKGSPEQMLAMLRKAKGVKEEELAWSGVEAWIKEQPGPVTREALVDYLRANELTVDEVTKGDTAERRAAQNQLDALARLGGERTADEEREYERLARSLRTGQESGGAPKFGKYTIPGGENYREVLLTLPPRLEKQGRYKLTIRKDGAVVFEHPDVDAGAVAAVRDKYGNTDADGRQIYTVQAEEIATASRTSNFQSAHFDEPNVVAHLRMNDRIGADGARVLFVEEVQSDWHEVGRRKGYQPTGAAREALKATLAAAEKAHQITLDALEAARQAVRDYGRPDDSRERLALVLAADAADHAHTATWVEVEDARKALTGGVPDAPFKTTWATLAIKRAIRYAAEQGYDRIAWTPGVVQNDRYDLSKHVTIEYAKQGSDKYWVHVREVGTGRDVTERTVSAEELVDLVGKEHADKIVANEGRPRISEALQSIKERGKHTGIEESGRHFLITFANGKQMGTYVSRASAEREAASIDRMVDDPHPAILEGDNLKVGGSGMIGFYDKILPIAVNKFAKPFGAKVEETHLSDATGLANDSPAHAVAIGAAPVHSLDISSGIQEAALGGLSLFQEQQGRRGSIKFGADRQMTISLFEKANLSTFLHESGHFFLEVFGDVFDKVLALDPATLTAQQRQVLEDYGAIREYLGATHDGKLSVAQHEKFARSFEAYLLEGQAPSLELRSAFARFRAWLLGVYRTLKGLDVKLSKEVRQVFDRMLATEAAIAQAAAEGQVAAMFTTAEAAGMSPAQFELYRATVADASRTAREQLEARLLSEVQREQEANWKEARAAIQATVTQEVNAQPVYRAIAAMQRGTNPDGTPLEEGVDLPPLKLSKQILIDRYGKERLKRLPRPFIYAVDGGLDPDTAAEMFGYSSGDALLAAVEQAEPPKAAIERETSRRMIAEHGSLLLDGTLHEAAQAAISNEDRESVIRAELRALGQLRRTVKPFVQAEKKQARTDLQAERAERAYERRWFEAEKKLELAIAQGHKQVEIDALTAEVQNLRAKARGGAATIRAAIPPAGAMRDAALARIAGTRVRDLNPGVFWSASRRAAGKAIDLAARQDFDGAIVAKQQELLNLHLFRQAELAKRDALARVKRAKDLAKPAARSRLGLAGEAYLDQVDGILDRFEFAHVSRKVLDRRASLRKFVAGLEGEGLPVDMPEELLEEARRTNYQELTVEELIGVSDGLDHLVHLARLKLRLLKGREAKELAAVAGALADSIRSENRNKPRAAARDRRPAEERRRAIADFFGGHRKLASILREMDGFQDGGPAWEAIMLPLNEAGTREAEMTAAATRGFAELVEKAFPGRTKGSLYIKSYIPQVNRSLSRMERIMVAANWGNEGNRDRVRRAEGWDNAQVQAILDTLNAGDLQFVQGVFDLVNGFWPEIEAKQKRVYGVAPAKVEAVPITAQHGTIPGGYFPLKYDDRLSAKAIASLDLEAANLAKQAAYAQATTKRGHTQERAQKVKLPIRLDFGVMFEHVAQVIHDLTHHEALIDVGRILGHADVQQAILDTQGDQVYKQIRNTVKDVAFGNIPAINGFERAINHLRAGATVAGLGWNLTTSLLQPIGLSNSIVRIGPTWVLKGLTRWLRNPLTMVETVRWIEESSAFMRARGRTQQREIAEVRNQVRVSTGTMGGWVDEVLSKTTLDYVSRQGVADSYFWMIQQAQRFADVPTWLGQYEKSLAAGETEERAIALADQAVLDSQGGGQTKDLAHVQRGGPMLRLWTNFYSYFNVVYNQAAEAKRRTNPKHPAEVGRLMSDYFFLFILPPALGFLIKEAIRPGKDKPEPEEERATKLGLEVVSSIAGTMLGVREVSSLVAGTYGYEGPAGARAFSSLGKLTKQIKQGEADEAFWRALNETSGILFHYPAGQIARTVGGVAALIEGKTDNPGAIIAGPPPKR